VADPEKGRSPRDKPKDQRRVQLRIRHPARSVQHFRGVRTVVAPSRLTLTAPLLILISPVCIWDMILAPILFWCVDFTSLSQKWVRG
jgi:hypothetical protein